MYETCVRVVPVHTGTLSVISQTRVMIDLALGIESDASIDHSPVAPDAELRRDDSPSSHHWRTRSRFPGSRLHTNIIVAVVRSTSKVQALFIDAGRLLALVVARLLHDQPRSTSLPATFARALHPCRRCSSANCWIANQHKLH